MAYNKNKHLESAQKYLGQGKLAQAINEYKHILKNEPNDQVTLMTVGDLYVRDGDTKSALEHFEQLAKAFGKEIAELVAQAAATDQRVERQLDVIATVPSLSDEPVAKFKLTISLKRRAWHAKKAISSSST